MERIHWLGCNIPVGGVAAEGGYLVRNAEATVHLLQPLECFQHPRPPVQNRGGLKAEKVNLLIDDATAIVPEKETSCSLENYLSLPDHSMDERIAAARERLGRTTILLGHHYQRDEVIRFADFTGDSYKLSKAAAETEAQYIVFCGVHFMAESADVLGREDQKVILPDLNAGCSMADMAEISQVEACWEELERLGLASETIPLTYMNSTAAIKAFCGEREGLVCTSSNARAAFEWAFARGRRILFLPDQHLGRNTGFAMGIPIGEMQVWDPWALQGGQTGSAFAASRVLLWKGHCSVHQRFLPSHVDEVRAKYPDAQVIVHPECRREVCQKADALGSTERIIKLVEESSAGTTFAIGTEIHLVNRLARQFAPQGKRIISLESNGCLCTTMYRISPQHLAWALENLVEGRVVNRIKVRSNVKRWARVALDRMLEVG